MEFFFWMTIFVLSVTFVAESLPHGLNDFDPILKDILAFDSAMEMSELHPVFLHSSPPQNFRRGQTNPNRDSNKRTPASSNRELSFGFLPLNPKPSRLAIEQGTEKKVSSGLISHDQRHFEPTPEATHQTFSPGLNVLKHGSLVSGESRFERDSRAQRLIPEPSKNVRQLSFGVSNQHSKLDQGLESVRRPTTHARHEQEKVRNPTSPSENTFSHYYRSFHRNSHPDSNRNPLDTRQNIRGNNNNLRAQRPDRTYIVTDNPTYSHSSADGRLHSHERKVHQNYYDAREKPNSNGHRTRTVLFLKSPSMVTTERPSSAPLNSRVFRTRPQHVSQQSEIEHSNKPRPHSVSLQKPLTVSRHNVKHVDFLVTITNSSLDNGRKLSHAEPLSGLEGQHSHRLEKSDQNLYYKNDPFLDITEVYSHRPGSSDHHPGSKSLNLEDRKQPDSKIPPVVNKHILADSKPPTFENKIYPAIKDKSKSANLETKHQPDKTSEIKDIKPTFQNSNYPVIKDRNSSNSEDKMKQGSPSSSKGPVSFSSSVSMAVNRKRGRKTSAKMTLKKSMSMKKKTKIQEDPSSIPGNPGTDYPTYEEIPSTNFDCRDLKSPGYYADMETGCQVFHNCDSGHQKHSFLCPNGTIFRQELFICDWWYNVRCSEAPDFFNLNTGLHPKTPGTN